ncbi:hypothetical protein FHX37_4629 [Haloactinospora alba]|uniref:Tail terminator n=1 Tax=Haloactinospora alba TaxID=405555 RepID=A0A543N2N8_9ACTN|nr:minor capsid protein [Haloactinospora alba]TQN26091.1 hypothetical protein FHX37_4629 [Haloactinospora alba]
MTLTEEVANLLVSLDVGTYHADGTPGGTIYLTALPPRPDVALAVALYGGGSEASVLHPYDEPRVQVRTRGTAEDVRTGERLAQDAYDALHGLGMRTMPGGTWLQLAVGLQSGPAYMGRDDSGRHEWTVNVRIEVQRSTPNRTG